MLIAPASASTIGKMANGIADNMLITTYLSCKAPVFVAPAMDLDMYAHPSTQQNLDRLRSFGNTIIEPASGELASGLEGKGRMEEPEVIVEHLKRYFTVSTPLKGKRILITAGPTYEKIDPVRFIGNYSSGKMGYALAEECAALGAEVHLVSGPTSLSPVHTSIIRHEVESASQMNMETTKLFNHCDAAILCAAVADFTPASAAQSKIKREGEELILTLVPTQDIAAALGKMKTDKQILVGFALETDNELLNAAEKMKRKNFDFIVLNSLREEGAGFRHDTNKISIIESNGNTIHFDLKPKQQVAGDIVNHLVSYL